MRRLGLLRDSWLAVVVAQVQEDTVYDNNNVSCVLYDYHVAIMHAAGHWNYGTV